jgi:hypothetical protein
VSGEPTGAIVEHNPRPTAEFDLLPAVPRFGFAERSKGLLRSIALYHARGTTSVYEGHGSAPETISVYRDLWERGELTMRTGLCVSPSWESVAEAGKAMRDWLSYARGRGLGDPWLRISGIHIAYGGDAMVARVARENLPDTGWAGFVEQVYTSDEFRDVCFLAAEHDLRLHTIVGNDLHEIVPRPRSDQSALPSRRQALGHRAYRQPFRHGTMARSSASKPAFITKPIIAMTNRPTYMVWTSNSSHAFQIM